MNKNDHLMSFVFGAAVTATTVVAGAFAAFVVVAVGAAAVKDLKVAPFLAGALTSFAVAVGVVFVMSDEPGQAAITPDRLEPQALEHKENARDLSAAFETADGQRIHLAAMCEQTARIVALHRGPAP